MIQSMTGYGSAEKGEFRVEIRSLNHRFIEINIRMPQDLLKHDIALRNMIRKRFSRGKFDVNISLLSGRAIKIGIDTDRAKALYDALNQLRDDLGLLDEIKVDTMVAFKDMILREDFEYNINSLFEAFNEALDELATMREDEGENLKIDLEKRIDSLDRMMDMVKSYSSDLIIDMKDRMSKRIRSLMGDVSLDEGRILQEIAMIAEKSDINEEITRIDSHLGQMRKILLEGDTIGRRIEFILQELFREVNTISSKIPDYRVSSILVDMRAEIERMREQSQNIQ